MAPHSESKMNNIIHFFGEETGAQRVKYSQDLWFRSGLEAGFSLGALTHNHCIEQNAVNKHKASQRTVHREVSVQGKELNRAVKDQSDAVS